MLRLPFSIFSQAPKNPHGVASLPMIHLGQFIKACIGVSQRLMLRLADKWRPLSGARQEHAQDVSPSFGALRAEHESARSIDFVNCSNHFALHPIFIIIRRLLEPFQ